MNVLFLCTGNSARSVLAEALLRHHGAGRFQSFSAGSHPTGRVNPLALVTLAELGLPTKGFRSKSWDEFEGDGAPQMDIVITVCDDAAGEACPLWVGTPMTAHWGVPDPAAIEGSEEVRLEAFRAAARTLGRRIEQFASLPFEALDRLALQKRLEEIGEERKT